MTRDTAIYLNQRNCYVDSQSEQESTVDVIGMFLFLGTLYPSLIYLKHAKFLTYTENYRLLYDANSIGKYIYTRCLRFDSKKKIK